MLNLAALYDYILLVLPVMIKYSEACARANSVNTFAATCVCLLTAALCSVHAQGPPRSDEARSMV